MWTMWAWMIGCRGTTPLSETVSSMDTGVTVDTPGTQSDSGSSVGTPPVGLEVCAPLPFPDVVARIHACREPCGGSVESCSWDSTPETGWSSRSVRVVAAGRGAVVRYSERGAATLFVHDGGTGTTFAPRRLPDAFVAAGGRVVEVAWHTASSTGTDCNDADCGWMTRPLETEPSSIEEVATRPASVIRFAHDTLSPQDPFGTVSCSAGSLATFYARYFDDLDPLLDYQMWLGGPLLYSAEWGCTGRTSGCGGSACGRCRTDPDILCEVGAPGQCVGAGGTCASYRLTGSLGLLDVLYLNEASCPAVAGTDYAVGDAATTPGDTHLEHPVDLVLSTNLPAQLGDDDLGIVPHVWDVYTTLTGPDVTASFETGPHCGTFSEQATCERVLTRLGLGDSAAAHCGP